MEHGILECMESMEIDGNIGSQNLKSQLESSVLISEFMIASFH